MTTEARGVVVAGGRHIVDTTITRDGETYDLSGKTVRARVRMLAAPRVVVHDSLEAIPVIVGDGPEGEVWWELTSEMSAHLDTPQSPTHQVSYTVQYHVVEDDFYPGLLVLRVRRPG